jgi:FlaA1/EpsC-like NDP-sugar epimerase
VLARTSYRLLHRARGRARHSGSPMVIYGAGEAGSLALREIWINDVLMFRPVAFVDDDPRKKGTLLNGVEVAGGLDEVPALSRRYGPLTLLVASRKIGGVRLLDVAKVCTENGARLLRMELVFRELLPPGQERRRPEPRTEGGES